MARDFESTSSEYIGHFGSSPIAAYPHTMACWARAEADTIIGAILALHADVNGGSMILYRGDLANDPIQAYSENVTLGSAGATSGATPAEGTWFHAAAVYASATSRTIYLNGAATSNATSIVIPSLINVGIGTNARLIPGDFFDGDVCEAGFWSAALSAAQIAELADGFAPPLVAPDSLQVYVPLVRTVQDLVGGLAWTTTGTVVSAHYPRVINPTRRKFVFHPAAAAAAGIGRQMQQHGLYAGRS